MTIPAGETLFLDTNILLTATDEGRRGHAAACDLFRDLPMAGYSLAISSQICREYLVVATRKVEQNGLGLKPSDALTNIRQFRRRTQICEESDRVLECLLTLVERHGLLGKRIHDANVAATMMAHGISWLLTENLNDFTAFAEVRALNLTALPKVQ